MTAQIIPIRKNMPVKALMSEAEYRLFIMERKRAWEVIAEQILDESEKMLKAAKVLTRSRQLTAMQDALQERAVTVRDALIDCDRQLEILAR